MSQKRLACRSLLFLVVFIGLALGLGSSAQEPPLPPDRVPDPPTVSVAGSGFAPEELSPEERERLIQDALNNLWLYIPDLETHQPKPLTPTADNGQIAYVGTDGHLYLMNPDGTAQRKILDDLSSIAWWPTWSHDSQYLAFAVDGENSDRCLYKFHLDTRAYTELVCGFASLWAPEWSPQDNRIVFFGEQEAETGECAWAIDADGNNLTALAPGLTQMWRPVWVDEDKVAFPGESSPQAWRLYVVDPDQPNDPQPITPEFTCGGCSCSGALVAFPDVSPDGQQIAFLGARFEGDKFGFTGYLAVYLVDPPGANPPSRIVDVASSSSSLAMGMLKWASDNQRVGVYARGGGPLRLNVVNTISGTRTMLPDREGPDWRALDWSPDATRLATGYSPSGADPQIASVDPISQTFDFLVYGELPTWGSYPQAPEPFLELPFGYSCQHDDYWNHFGEATDAEFRRAFSYVRPPRVEPLPCQRATRITAFFDHQDPLYPARFYPIYGFGCERTTGQIPTTVVTYEGQAFEEGWGANQRQYSGHPAYDFSTYTGNDLQTPVFAAADGTFDWAGRVSDACTVRLRHELSDGQVYYTEYVHLLQDRWFSEIKNLSTGTEITASRRIGTMDSTGISTGPHLHFEVKVEKKDAEGNIVLVPVDPSGFQSEDFPIDPWTRPFTDSCNTKHGVMAESYYLWIHSLIVDEAVDSSQPTSLTLPSGDVQVILPAGAVPWSGIAGLIAAPDPSPTILLAGTGHAFHLRVRSSQGEFLQEFQTDATVNTNYALEDAADLVPDSLALYHWDSDARAWQELSTSLSSAMLLIPRDSSILSATATITQTGLYALLGEPAEDLVAPQTVVTVTGTIFPHEPFYTGTVTLEASASDEGGSGLARTEYSLDHGMTWQTYTSPLTFDPPYWLDVWVRSIDGIGNIEYPAVGVTISYLWELRGRIYLPIVMQNE